ncbi:hypothetical protein LTR53_018873, partial [Teratosphaeriaceae sp. CCFEE 6253]
MDWSVKLWRAGAATATSSASAASVGQGAAGGATAGPRRPLLEIAREDVVYDVRWSPTRPSVFGCVDGAGKLDIYDLLLSTEVPVASARPGVKADKDGKDVAPSGAPYGVGHAGMGTGMKALNKLAWEKTQGRQVAVGGLEGVATVFE